MNTTEIMKVALRQAGISKVPADSEIHVPGENLRRALMAIDVSAAELIYAKENAYDVVIAHHPMGGSAKLDGHKVFQRHVDLMREMGIPRKAAQDAVASKLRAVEVANHVANYDQNVVLARRLGIACMSVHSPCDMVGRQVLIDTLSKGMPKRGSKVAHVVKALMAIAEFQKAKTKIEVRLGSARNLAGRVAVVLGAFTNGGYDIAKTYFEHNIGTVIYIHVLDADLEKLRKDGKGNLVVTGHIASDWIGLNRLTDELTEMGLQVTRLTDIQ